MQNSDHLFKLAAAMRKAYLAGTYPPKQKKVNVDKIKS